MNVSGVAGFAGQQAYETLELANDYVGGAEYRS